MGEIIHVLALTIPIVTLDSSPEPLCIDWNGLQSTVSAVEFLKRNAWYSAELSEANKRNCFMHRNDFDATEQVQMANNAVHKSSVRGMVFIAIHSGRIYYVLNSMTNSSSGSPFEGGTDEAPSGYSSYEDYFQKRYGITLSFPEEPLFLLKQSHNAHNLLEDFRNTGQPFFLHVKCDSRIHFFSPFQILNSALWPWRIFMGASSVSGFLFFLVCP